MGVSFEWQVGWLNLALILATPGWPGLLASLYLEPQLWPQEVAVSLRCAVSPPELVITYGRGWCGGIEQHLIVGYMGRLQAHDL